MSEARIGAGVATALGTFCPETGLKPESTFYLELEAKPEPESSKNPDSASRIVALGSPILDRPKP